MSKQSIYLAGNISGLSHYQATSWRNTVTKILSDKYDVLDPMRGKEHLANTFLEFTNKSIGCSAKEIFERDTCDVIDCNIVFTYITKHSIGTCFELGLAYAMHKYIVVVTTDEFIKHPFLSESADYITTSFDEAVSFLLKDWN